MAQPVLELIDDKLVKLVDLFSNNPDREFYLREISRLTNIPPATTYRLIHKLLDKEIIEQKIINKFKLYKLKNNEKAKKIAELFSKKKNALEVFKEEIAKIPEVQLVYLLEQRRGENKLNVLILGSGIDPGEIKKIIVKIKEDFDLTINHLTLTFDQYDKMISMGLFPGKKSIIFQR